MGDCDKDEVKGELKVKKKLILMGVAAALVTTAFIGGSLAYFQADGQEVRQQINTPELSIDLMDETTGEKAAESYTFDDAMPGASIDLENKLVVKNTGNTPLYTRVTVTKSWGDGTGEAFEKDFEGESGKIAVTPEEGWYVMENTDGNEENLYLYYRYPVEAGTSTASILKALEISEDLGNRYTDKAVQLSVDADAVQVSSAEDAILAEWGVFPTFDEEGAIISIEE